MSKGEAVGIWLSALALAACGAKALGSAGAGSNQNGGSAGQESGVGGGEAGAAAGISAGAGVGGSTAGAPVGSGAGAGAEPPDISGRWAMFDFEDPVTVDITQQGSTLSGTGSCAPSVGLPLACSGPLLGSFVDGHAVFSFDVDGLVVYATNAAVSEGAARMAGTFGGLSLRDFNVAWLRIPAGAAWLEGEHGTLAEFASAHQAEYELALSAATGSAFSHDQTYRLRIRSNGAFATVSGSLGAFWEREMSWHEDSQTLEVGPVPVTMPELAIALQLRFDDAHLVEVEATMPNGDVYRFDSLPPE